jgi:hypothetical protein
VEPVARAVLVATVTAATVVAAAAADPVREQEAGALGLASGGRHRRASACKRSSTEPVACCSRRSGTCSAAHLYVPVRTYVEKDHSALKHTGIQNTRLRARACVCECIDR